MSSNFATSIRSMAAKKFSLAAFQHVLSPCLFSVNVRSKLTILDRPILALISFLINNLVAYVLMFDVFFFVICIRIFSPQISFV